ncbi:MAG: hypothetical protein ACJASL_000425 [Paraglaciecola sp.]|jgi:hypothetical protein
MEKIKFGNLNIDILLIMVIGNLLYEAMKIKP